MHLQYNIEGGNFTKAGFASSEIKKVLKKLNLEVRIIKRIVVALYEAEVNVVAHAYQGVVDVDILPEKVRVVISDVGPGILNIDQAMTAGFSTATKEVRDMGFGAGMGLPNIKKNADVFFISSKVGEGTEVIIEINLH
mgnify:CR=1 FL=1